MPNTVNDKVLKDTAKCRCWLLYVPATCLCISGTDLPRQLSVLPHRDRSSRSNYPTQPQYTDTGPTSPSADSIMPGAWQASHWSANFEVTGMTPPGECSTVKAGIEPKSAALHADALPLGR